MSIPMLESRIYNNAFAEYGKLDVVLWDLVDVTDGETLLITFESTNSTDRQGIWMALDKSLSINGRASSSVVLWADTAPKRVEVKIETSTGKLNLYNIFENRGRQDSQCHSSGMIVDRIDDGFRYRCTDIGFDLRFDRLVFTLTRASK